MFDVIFDRIKNRIWIDISESALVDMIIGAYIQEDIDEEEKETLLDLI